MQRLWIFQFTQPVAVADQLLARIEDALKDWAAHKVPVASRVTLPYGAFLIIEALSDTSGCSIDWLRHTVEQVCHEAGVQLAPPTQIAYKAEDDIHVIAMNDLPDALAQGLVTADTIIFDNTVAHAGSLVGWEKPLGHSWLAQRLAIR